jgi:hypothetical protein
VWQEEQSMAAFPWGLAMNLELVLVWQPRHFFDFSRELSFVLKAKIVSPPPSAMCSSDSP